MRRERRAFLPACLSATALCIGIAGSAQAQSDPMLDGDFIDPLTNEVAILQPSVPWITAGADGKLGTSDDVVDFGVVGDIDIVVRAGVTTVSGAIPATAPLRGTGIPLGSAGGFGNGIAIPFIVFASDGAASPAAGSPVAPLSLEGAPVLVMAFADLDDDGYVGITELDGNPNDAETEEAELDPVGRRFAFFEAGVASGELHVGTGGPTNAELTILLAAAAFTGPRDPAFFGGEVPTGPIVLTRLPFLPRTDPDSIIEGNIPEPASVDGLVGVEIRDEFTPNPNAAYGEAFTIATDGSDPSVDVALVRAGSFASVGLVRPVDPASFDSQTGGSLHPGLDEMDVRILLEAVDGFAIGIGPGDHSAVQVVAMDLRSNLADPGFVRDALLIASGGVSIDSPDTDFDPLRETIRIRNAAGETVALSGSGMLLVEEVPMPACGRGWSLAVLATLSVVRGRRNRSS